MDGREQMEHVALRGRTHVALRGRTHVALRGRTGEAFINAGWGKTAGKECKAKNIWG